MMLFMVSEVTSHQKTRDDSYNELSTYYNK